MSKKKEEKQQTIAQSLTANEVNEVIEVCLATPMEGYPRNAKNGDDESKKKAKEEDEVLWGLPVLIEGEPGIAKTARLKQLARTIKVKARSLFAAQHPPEDFSGALIPDGKGGARQICPLAQVRELAESDEPAIIFLDEINGAPPTTQGALQSFIHERVAGDQRLPGRIRVIAAQNPAEIATGGFDLSAPLANRFVHLVDPGPTPHDWINWLMGTSNVKMQQPLAVIESMIADDWPNLFPESQALFAGFMERAGATHLHNRPDTNDPQSSKAWPSHRTWDYALRAYTAARIMEKNDSVRDAIIEACVGPGAAVEFLAYASSVDLPKPTDVLNGWKPDKDRLDIIFAAYTGMVAYVRQRPTRKEKIALAPKAWGSLKHLVDLGVHDLVAPAALGLAQEQLGRNSNDPTIMKAASEILLAMSKAGMQSFLEEQA